MLSTVGSKIRPSLEFRKEIKFIINKSEILKDKTMCIEIMYVPNNDKQNLPLNCKLKRLDTTGLESTNQNSI